MIIARSLAGVGLAGSQAQDYKSSRTTEQMEEKKSPNEQADTLYKHR